MKKPRYSQDWEIFYMDSFTKSVIVKKVTQEDFEKLTEIQVHFLQDNGFVLIYHFSTGIF